MYVTKSSGMTQQFEESKIKTILDWAAQSLSINVEEILDELQNYMFDGIPTSVIQKTLVKISADKITTENPDFQFFAARLKMFQLRKEVYNSFTPIPFYELIKKNTDVGVYDKEIITKFTKEEIELLETHIKHNRDMFFSYAGAMQIIEKYLVKDRSTSKIYETPQFAYMLISMCLHQEEQDNKIEKIIKFYNAVSNSKLSLPTPIMAGVRTPTRQFSSCVLIESGDNLDSISATSDAIMKYISKRAGIGINGGNIRAEGSKIRSGEVKHTGVIPFWKHFQTAVKSCSQGGIRGGAATLFYPLWHLEVEKLLVLKNNRGVEENRIRQMDYGVQLNDFMFERLYRNGVITLFSPHVADGKLYDYFFSDKHKFKELYEQLEQDESVTKKQIKAIDLFSIFELERSSTSRLYPMFVDNVNENSPFIEPIRQSNLCLEIALPTKPMTKTKGEGEIALCTLAAFNMANVTIDEMPELALISVRAIDNLLSYQDYLLPEAEHAKSRRSLGFGVINFACWLAKQGYNYSDSNPDKLQAVHEWFEAFQYNLLTASSSLARERGQCKYFHKTTYSLNELPIDRKQKVYNYPHLNYELKCNWELLRAKIHLYGLRNSTLTALMPSESSSQVHNATNGIEPPRGPISVKGSKDGVFNQVIPLYKKLKDNYEYCWDMAKKGNKGYLDMCAIIQKFIDQTISANEYYDPSIYHNNKIPMTVLLTNLSYSNNIGLKTLYYSNMRDGGDGSEEYVDENQNLPELPSILNQEDEVCDSCSI